MVLEMAGYCSRLQETETLLRDGSNTAHLLLIQPWAPSFRIILYVLVSPFNWGRNKVREATWPACGQRTGYLEEPGSKSIWKPRWIPEESLAERVSRCELISPEPTRMACPYMDCVAMQRARKSCVRVGPAQLSPVRVCVRPHCALRPQQLIVWRTATCLSILIGFPPFSFLLKASAIQWTMLG